MTLSSFVNFNSILEFGYTTSYCLHLIKMLLHNLDEPLKHMFIPAIEMEIDIIICNTYSSFKLNHGQWSCFWMITRMVCIPDESMRQDNVFHDVCTILIWDLRISLLDNNSKIFGLVSSSCIGGDRSVIRVLVRIHLINYKLNIGKLLKNHKKDTQKDFGK